MNRQNLARFGQDRPALASLVWIAVSVAGYLLANYLAGFIVLFAQEAGVDWDPYSTAGSMILRVVIYVATIAIMVWWLWASGLGRRALLEVAGLTRALSWKDLGRALIGFVGYGILTVTLLFIASQVGGFDSAEAQDVGVGDTTGINRWVIFVGLVVLAPVAEEVMFRGLLYGYLRRLKWPLVLAMLVVSALFGIAHGQWNVGLDTFALSVVMVGLRELTGSIWAGLVVHMIKNGLATFLLFFLQFN